MRSIVFNAAVAGLLTVVTCPPIGLGGSVHLLSKCISEVHLKD